MKYITVNFVLLLLFFISTINQVQCLCVLESDFGFSFNCNFKKAGLFRVRNLGGLKAHFGLGFSVGDELGFPESLSNAEPTNKRSLDIKTGSNTVGVLPAGKMPVNEKVQPTISPLHTYQIQTRSPRMSGVETPREQRKIQLMTEAKSIPLGAPRFKTLPSHHLTANNPTIPPALPNYQDNRQLTGAERFLKTMASTGVQMKSDNIQAVYIKPVPSFQALPSSITSAQFAQPTKVEYYPRDEDLPAIDLKGHSVEELAAMANVSVEVIKSAIKLRQQQLMMTKATTAASSAPPKALSKIVRTTRTTSSPPRSTIGDVTTQSPITLPSTTPFETKKKVTKKPVVRSGHKVMNAPKEYYPAGYDKNFDDNFKSRIDLPLTSFHCGDQKHFPGLYSDPDLGCMVFHVCALTDDGLIMKSFLCPESTLFDQTILKCNWWFYTDCKSSKTLYDSNLPVSKSYQLMKSLSYFNKNYKKSANATFHEISDTFNEKTTTTTTTTTTEGPKLSIIRVHDQR